uniref:C2H2-type domain-containing protein n=1 Tax=Globodera rostochiensis TaxID=31243 RepID=A0A914GZQ7_GLORO
MFSINDDNNNNNNNSALFHCKFCASANDCPPADAARLFNADDLLQHIYVHLNYRPHRCKYCNFAATTPFELFEHSQKKANHWELSFFNARNVFYDEIAQVALEKCMNQQIKGTGDDVPPMDDSERGKLVIDDSTPPCERSLPSLDSSAYKLEVPMEPIDIGILDGEQENEAACSVSVGQQNLSPFQRAFQKCVRVPVHANYPAHAAGNSNTKTPKTECVEPAQQQQNAVVGSGTERMTLSQDQCAECFRILPDIPDSRLHHTNLKHLKLSLYKCPFCSKEFPYVNYGLGHCKQHIRVIHPGMPMPSDEEFTLPNLSEKMKQIQVRAAELFVFRVK